MPVQRQLLTFPFALGLDSKTDEKQVALGRLHELENGVFTTLKQLRKRNGYDALTRRAVGMYSGVSVDQQISDASALTSFQDELLLVGRTEQRPAESQVLSYSEGSQAWIAKGEFVPCDVSVTPIHRGLDTIAAADGCVLDSGSLEVFAWEDNAGRVLYGVRDTASGQIVVDGSLVSATAAKPRVVAFAGGALIYFIDTALGVVSVAPVLASLTSSIGTATQITSAPAGLVTTISTVVARRAYDVLRVENQLLFTFCNDAGGLTAQLFDGSNPYLSTGQQVVTPATAPSVVGSAFDSTGARVAVVYSDGTNTASYAVTDRFLTASFGAAVPVTLTAGFSVKQLAMLAVPEAPDATRFRAWVSATDGSSRWATWLYVGGPSSTTASRTMRTLSLAGKPWAYRGQGFVPLVFVSRTTGALGGYSSTGLQNQVVIVTDSTTTTDPVARVLYGTSVGVPFSFASGQTPLPGSWPIGSAEWRVSSMEYTLAAGESVASKLSPGVVSLGFDFESPPLSDNRSELAETLVLGGGVVSLYDGATLSELNFLAWPDEVTVASGVGSNLGVGTYQWVACYEWMDNAGNVHRSAPSLPATLTLAAPATATVTVSTLQFTSKTTPVRLVLYRTLTNGTTFYRVSSAITPTLNDQTVFTVNISDTVTDATLESQALLYTTGGVVENIAPPALASLIVHRSRLWGIDAANRLRLWFSRQVQTGAPVEFSESFIFDVDARGGPVTALASLDDKLIVFKANSILAVSGQGPDATNQRSDFSDAVFVTADVGCVDARSLVVTPTGLIFQTAKGIYLLDRSLQASYIGAPVERYNDATVESSQLIPTANQVRFILSTGIALVFDYFVEQWSVFTNHPGVDSVVWLDRFSYLRSDGRVLVENPDRFDDAGAFVALRLVTGWVSFDSINAGAFTAVSGARGPQSVQVFQRARRLLILGEYLAPHELQVDLSFDFADAVEQSVRVSPADPNSYGESSPYGNESPFGGMWTPYQWRVDFTRQKTQAVRVALTEIRPRTNIGAEAVRLSALAFEIGIKSGPFRVPMGSVYG